MICVLEVTLMFRRFKRHVKEGFIGVIRHAALSLSSASAVMITLLLISIFLIVTSNLQRMTMNIESAIKISATVKSSNESKAELQRIEKEIQAIPGVVSTQHRTKEEEYQFYLDTYLADAKELFHTFDNENPFLESFTVVIDNGDKIETIRDQIATIQGIEDVEFGGISSLKLLAVLNSVRFIGLILVLALCILAIYLVYNTIKITIATRVDEIWIMRNVGAKNGYVRAPFLVEGIIIGFLGSLIPIIITIFGYIYLYTQSGGYLVSELFSLIKPHPYVLYVSFVLLTIGVFVGFVGSYISVHKYLRLRR